MPEDCYFFDSYLWLDETIIIRAELMNRWEANRIFDSIVNRRKDPSILQKNWGNTFSLNVYPISTAYSRKVKISYSAPFSENKKVHIPYSIIQHILPNSIVSVKINNDNNFKYVDVSKISQVSSVPSQNNDGTILQFLRKNYSAQSSLNFSDQKNSNIIFRSQHVNTSEGFF